ncbi:MAG TPA: hypothetical protein VJ952_02545 [Opitutales bacterium]|nr:hypothetical protein [Opitutales bacterium]
MLLADLRKLWPLVIFALVLQTLRLGTMVGWFGTPAPDLAMSQGQSLFSTFLGLPLILVPLMILVIVLIHHCHPAWESFITTRPISKRRRVLTCALVVALMFWLPVVLVDFLALVLTGQPTALILPAVADSMLWYGVWLAVLMPAFWLWRTFREINFGLVSMIGAIGFSMLALWGWFEFRWIGHDGVFFMSAMTRPRLLLGALMLGLALWGFLLWQIKRGWLDLGRRSIVAASIVALCTSGFFLLPRERSEANAVIEASDFKVRLLARNPAVLSVESPINKVGSAVESMQVLRKLILDEGKVPVWPRPVHSVRPRSGFSMSYVDWSLLDRIRQDTSAEYLVMGTVPAPAAVKAWHSYLPGLSLHVGESHEVSMDFAGLKFEWEKMVELPVKPGASEAGWVLAQVVGDAFGSSAVQAEAMGNSYALSLHFRLVRGFLEGLPSSDGAESRLGAVLINDDAQSVWVASHGHMSKESLSGPSGPLGWYGLKIGFPKEAKLAPNQRLLIYRKVETGRFQTTWSSTVEVVDDNEGGSRSADHPLNREASEVAQWMSENTPPIAGAAEAEIRHYLVGLLSQIHRLRHSLDADHPAIAWLAQVASQREDGVELLLRARQALAVNEHRAQRAIDAALSIGFSREDLPLLTEVDPVLEEAATRGWLNDIGAELAKRAKQGDSNMLEHLMKLPDFGGLSREELLNIFREAPSTRVYRYLKQDDQLKATMDQQVQEWFEAIPPSIDHSKPGFPLELALAAGHSEAPERLHRLGEAAAKTSMSLQGYFVGIVVESYFRDEKGRRYREAEDFLKEDPADFEFDEASGKYRLKGASQ